MVAHYKNVRSLLFSVAQKGWREGERIPRFKLRETDESAQNTSMLRKGEEKERMDRAASRMAASGDGREEV